MAQFAFVFAPALLWTRNGSYGMSGARSRLASMRNALYLFPDVSRVMPRAIVFVKLLLET